MFRTEPPRGEGVAAVASFLAEHAEDGPWACVGHSGVGKTSLIQALLPQEDVGPVGDVSTFWEQGRHTTTHSRLFALPGGGRDRRLSRHPHLLALRARPARRPRRLPGTAAAAVQVPRLPPP